MALPVHVKDGLYREPTAKRDHWFAKTSNFTLSIKHSGATFTNLGATGGVTFSLPTNASGEKGIRYTFAVMAAQTMTIDPGSSGAFYIGGAKQSDDETIASAQIGDVVSVVSDGNGDWLVTRKTGSWGHVDSDQIGGSETSDADSLPIPVTASYVAKTTGADGEACTLADGTPGQVLTVVLETDGGGDATITPSTASGWATVVLADAGDTVSLLFVDDTVGWVILGTAGVTAPPVISV